MEISQEQVIKFTNCRVLLQDKIQIDDLWVRNGRILDKSVLFFEEKRSPDVSIDCHNSIISPGFIDIQINGGFNVDFSNPDLDVNVSLESVAKKLLAHGVTSFCPTIISSPNETYKTLLPQYSSYMNHNAGASDRATVLGLHLEGPFINHTKRGMHSAYTLKPCSNGLSDLLEAYSSLSEAIVITIAPEISGAIETIRALTKRGIRVSLGHSTSGLEIGEEGIKAGASSLTHLFCAMQPFHHRDPCLIGLLASKRTKQPIYFGIIADLEHTHAAALRMAYRIRPDGVILVTDASPVMGCSDGVYKFGTETIEMRKGVCCVHGTNTLSGAVCPLDQCVRNFFKVTEASREDALLSVTKHPAQFLCLENKKGVLTPGADADFVFLDDDLHVKSTWVGGRLVYSADDISYSVNR